jgi:hypothetical protein
MKCNTRGSRTQLISDDRVEVGGRRTGSGGNRAGKIWADAVIGNAWFEIHAGPKSRSFAALGMTRAESVSCLTPRVGATADWNTLPANAH